MLTPLEVLVNILWVWLECTRLWLQNKKSWPPINKIIIQLFINNSDIIK